MREWLRNQPQLKGLDPKAHEVADGLYALPNRSQWILNLRERGETYQQIGERFDLSRERIRQIYLTAMRRIAEGVRRDRCPEHAWEPLSMGRRYCPRCRVLERPSRRSQR